jgi:hypothetical protein
MTRMGLGVGVAAAGRRAAARSPQPAASPIADHESLGSHTRTRSSHYEYISKKTSGRASGGSHNY